MTPESWSQHRATTENDLREARRKYRAAAKHGDWEAAGEAELAIDLIDLYFDSKPVLREDGRGVPSNFRRDLGTMLSGWRTPVTLAETMVKDTTEGFVAVIEVGHPELAVESLFVDETKRYHPRFRAELVERSRNRLASV